MVDIYFLADGKNLSWCYCCWPQEDNTKFHCDSKSTLQRLCIMLSDPEASQLISRHILLINHYLGLTNNVFKLSDLSYLMIVLEYLCREANFEKLYETPLISLLYMIQKPPTVNHTSQNEQYLADLCDYFTALANCYSSLTKHELKFLIISAINNMMCVSRKDENFVNQEFCIKALEQSAFAERFSAILATTQDKRDIGNVLDLFQHLTMLSDPFCLSLYEENYVERLLNLVPLIMDDASHTELHRAGFLLLRILSTTIISENYNPLVISQQAIRNLREWFKNDVLSGQKRKRNLTMTNILGIIRTQQSLDLASSHILEDIILLSVAPKYAREGTWTKYFELSSDTFDFEFKKLLLVTLYELFDYCPTKIVCERLDGVLGLSQLFDLKLWTEVENNILLMYSLHLVPRVAKYLHEEIIKYDMLSKMILRSGKLVERSDCNEVFFYLIQSIYSLTLNNDLTEYFKEKNIIPPLIDYCETIFKMTAWSVRIQMVLQFTLNSVVCIACKLSLIGYKCLRLSHPSTSNLSSDLLRRYIKPSENDSILDPCLIVAIADFIWAVQIRGAESKIEFIKSDGVFLTMDALEKEVKKSVNGGGTVVLLALLSDLLLEDLAVTQAVTWKGSKYSHLFNMLCDIWRLIEREKLVKRHMDTIQDCEAPLMGYTQASMEVKAQGSCPPLLEMIGCLRPKIFSIISQLLKHQKELVEITEDTYNALFRRMNTQDRATLEIIKNYEFLKEGEIWQNMLFSLKRNKTAPLVGDELLLHTLVTKHIVCARNIQQTQMKILEEQTKRDLEEEKNLYEKIKQSKIIEEVDKYREIEKNLIIQNNSMRLLMKQAQLSQIEDASQINWKKYGFIKTYNHRDNTTTLTIGRDIITSGKKTTILNQDQ